MTVPPFASYSMFHDNIDSNNTQIYEIELLDFKNKGEPFPFSGK